MNRLQEVMNARRAYVAEIGRLAAAIFRELHVKDPPTTFVSERYWVKVDPTCIRVVSGRGVGPTLMTVNWVTPDVACPPESRVQVHDNVTDEELTEAILVLTDLLSDAEV